MRLLTAVAGSHATTLMGVSLLHYRNVVRQRMMRYKQLVIAGLLLLLPSIAAFKATVIVPLVRIFTESGTVAAACGSAGFVAITAVWARMQHDAITYPATAPLIASLPFSKYELLRRDIVIVALASSPLLLLLMVAFGTSFSKTDAAHRIIALLAVLFASLVSQVMAVRGLFLRALVAVAAAVAIGSSHWTGLLALPIILCGVLLWRLPPHMPWRSSEYRQLRRDRGMMRAASIHWIGIHWRSLYRSRYAAYRLGVLASVLLTGVVAFALHNGEESVTRSGGLLLVHSALIVGLYGLGFATMFSNQSAYQNFLDSLPVGRLRRALDMIVAVEAPAVALVVLLGISALRLKSGAMLACVSLCAAAVLCPIQYLIYRHIPRHPIAAGLVTAILISSCSPRCWWPPDWMTGDERFATGWGHHFVSQSHHF